MILPKKKFIKSHFIEVEKIIKNFVQNDPNAKSLDYGCGGKSSKKFFEKGAYYTAEVSNSYNPDYLIVEDRINCNDNYFDLVLCVDVLEHCFEPLKSLDEMLRVTKKGGLIILTYPFSCNYHQEPYFYSSGFSEYWIKEYCRSRNLELKEILIEGNYHQVLIDMLKAPFYEKKISKFWQMVYLIIAGIIKLIALFSKINLPKTHTNQVIIIRK